MKNPAYVICFLVVFFFAGLGYAQDQKSFPDDPVILELIENECLLQLENLQLKKNELERQLRVVDA